MQPSQENMEHSPAVHDGTQYVPEQPAVAAYRSCFCCGATHRAHALSVLRAHTVGALTAGSCLPPESGRARVATGSNGRELGFPLCSTSVRSKPEAAAGDWEQVLQQTKQRLSTSFPRK